MQGRAPTYAEAISGKGAALKNCVGFIDCTKIQMNRPGGSGTLQRARYSGHKKFHCLVYQTVTTLDGLVFSMYGPDVGSHHGMTLYREIGIDAQLRDSLPIDGKQYCI